MAFVSLLCRGVPPPLVAPSELSIVKGCWALAIPFLHLLGWDHVISVLMSIYLRHHCCWFAYAKTVSWLTLDAGIEGLGAVEVFKWLVFSVLIYFLVLYVSVGINVTCNFEFSHFLFVLFSWCCVCLPVVPPLLGFMSLTTMWVGS